MLWWLVVAETWSQWSPHFFFGVSTSGLFCSFAPRPDQGKILLKETHATSLSSMMCFRREKILIFFLGCKKMAKPLQLDFEGIFNDFHCIYPSWPKNQTVRLWIVLKWAWSFHPAPTTQVEVAACTPRFLEIPFFQFASFLDSIQCIISSPANWKIFWCFVRSLVKSWKLHHQHVPWSIPWASGMCAPYACNSSCCKSHENGSPLFEVEDAMEVPDWRPKRNHAALATARTSQGGQVQDSLVVSC